MARTPACSKLPRKPRQVRSAASPSPGRVWKADRASHRPSPGGTGPLRCQCDRGAPAHGAGAGRNSQLLIGQRSSPRCCRNRLNRRPRPCTRSRPASARWCCCAGPTSCRRNISCALPMPKLGSAGGPVPANFADGPARPGQQLIDRPVRRRVRPDRFGGRKLSDFPAGAGRPMSIFPRLSAMRRSPLTGRPSRLLSAKSAMRLPARAPQASSFAPARRSYSRRKTIIACLRRATAPGSTPSADAGFQRNLFSVQQSVVQMRLDTASNLVDLYRSLGGDLALPSVLTRLRPLLRRPIVSSPSVRDGMTRDKVSTLLLFGATGDLAHRMLLPSLTACTRTGCCPTIFGSFARLGANSRRAVSGQRSRR